MPALELKVPPPIVALALAAGMWGISLLVPPLPVPSWARWVLALLLLVVGLAFDALGLLAFLQARTTINPLRPERTRALVTSGIYRITRNPMYVGLAFVLASWAVFQASLIALLGPVLFVLYITRFQVAPEERLLLQIFGEKYREYLQQVRRWL